MLQTWRTVSSASVQWAPGPSGAAFRRWNSDPLFLQVKESVSPAAAPYLPPLPEEYRPSGQTRRHGTAALQAASRPHAGIHQLGRARLHRFKRMKNLKASIPVEFLTGTSFNFYSWACGAILARAHARTGDPAHIAGYCGNSAVLDDALAPWAESYGDQTSKLTTPPCWKLSRTDTIKADIQPEEAS